LLGNINISLHEMSAIWLRAAAVLYSLGLLHAVLTLLYRRRRFFQPGLYGFTLGLVLHAVSLVEETIFLGSLPLHNTFETASACAFLMALAFLLLYRRYRMESAAVALFPLVFILTLVGLLGSPVGGWSSPTLRDALLMIHVALVLAGYSALLVVALASALYLMQERHLKRKSPPPLANRLPPLGTLDELITRSTALAFVSITFAVIVASVWASAESGARWITEPKTLISLATWALYLAMTYLRVTVGWRGRKAAYMALAVVGSSALTWATHAGIRGILQR